MSTLERNRQRPAVTEPTTTTSVGTKSSVSTPLLKAGLAGLLLAGIAALTSTQELEIPLRNGWMKLSKNGKGLIKQDDHDVREFHIRVSETTGYLEFVPTHDEEESPLYEIAALEEAAEMAEELINYGMEWENTNQDYARDDLNDISKVLTDWWSDNKSIKFTAEELANTIDAYKVQALHIKDNKMCIGFKNKASIDIPFTWDAETEFEIIQGLIDNLIEDGFPGCKAWMHDLTKQVIDHISKNIQNDLPTLLQMFNKNDIKVDISETNYLGNGYALKLSPYAVVASWKLHFIKGSPVEIEISGSPRRAWTTRSQLQTIIKAGLNKYYSDSAKNMSSFMRIYISHNLDKIVSMVEERTCNEVIAHCTKAVLTAPGVH